MHQPSKLPHLGPNVFSVMSALATEHQAINLAQGFPDFAPDPELAERLRDYVAKGYNQYAPGQGVANLRQQLVDRFRQRYGASYDVDTEVLITAGASEALFSTIMALVHAGDEVIIFEPAYDIYAPIIELAGGIVKRVALDTKDFSIPWDDFQAQLNQSTRMVIINSPHNPSGAVLRFADLQQLAHLLADTRALVLSDEVYSDIVYTKEGHQSAAHIEALRMRSIVVGSLGKTYHLTGWKIGFCLAPAALMGEIAKVHSINTFSVHAPSQWVLADLLARDAQQFADNEQAFIKRFLPKRSLFLQALNDTAWQTLPPDGGYFVSVDYSQINALKHLTDVQCCRTLTIEYGVAAIPYRAFYQQDPQLQWIRFCFAKKQKTLQDALAILKAIR